MQSRKNVAKAGLHGYFARHCTVDSWLRRMGALHNPTPALIRAQSTVINQQKKSRRNA
jgi:hypothetical protein